ncbi:radical SAM protein [Mycobacterium syngnathidarum]
MIIKLSPLDNLSSGAVAGRGDLGTSSGWHGRSGVFSQRRILVSLVIQAGFREENDGNPERSRRRRFATGGAGRRHHARNTDGGLAHRARQLAAAGLDRVNVSLDSVDRHTFARMTRPDRLPDVLDGLAAAQAAGLNPIKVNAVLQRGSTIIRRAICWRSAASTATS